MSVRPSEAIKVLEQDVLDLPRSLGPYTLLRRLAVGGMAEVYVAQTQGIGGFEKLVAIKVIHPHFAEDDHFIEMLVEEAKLSVQLSHVNIVQTFDLGCIDETYFIAMEYIEGADAAHVQKCTRGFGLPVPIDIAAYIIAEVCKGLHYAHQRRDAEGKSLGIVHRDVSPQNVLVTYAGEVKLIDFGVAKAAMGRPQTEVGVIKGKYYYMSPEQAWGDRVDPRTDIFAAGIVLHELLVGEMLYHEENIVKLLNEVRRADIPLPSTKRKDVPPELDRIVMRALKPEPEERYANAQEMCEALTRFLYQHSPGFTSARLGDYVQKLVPGEVGTSTIQTRSGGRDLESISLVSEDLCPMQRGEYGPPPESSLIFEIDEISGLNSEQRDVIARGETKPIARALATRSGRKRAPKISAKNFPSRTSTTPSSSIDDVTTPITDEEDELATTRTGKRNWEEDTLQGGEMQWEDPTIVDMDGAAAVREMIARGRIDAQAPPVEPPRDAQAELPGEKTVSSSETAGIPLQDPAAFQSPPAAGMQGVGPSSSGEPSYEAPFAPAPKPLPADITWRRQKVEAADRRLLVVGGVICFLLFFTGGVFALMLHLLAGPPPALEVVSVPAEVEVRVDGVVVGQRTPLSIQEGLEVGEDVELVLSHPGYESATKRVRIVGGAQREFFSLVAQGVSLRIEAVPAEAEIWVNGVVRGRGEIELQDLRAGLVEVDVELPGYQTEHRQLILEEREGTQSLRIELQAESPDTL